MEIKNTNRVKKLILYWKGENTMPPNQEKIAALDHAKLIIRKINKGVNNNQYKSKPDI